MLVVAIIGILSTLALTKYGQLLEKSKEGQTRGNLNSIHSAAAIYYGDQKGIWPTTLSTQSVYAFSQYLDTVGSVRVSGYFVAGARSAAGNQATMTTQGSVPTASGSGWLYDSTNGEIYVNSTVRDSKTLPYSFYGFE